MPASTFSLSALTVSAAIGHRFLMGYTVLSEHNTIYPQHPFTKASHAQQSITDYLS